MFLCNREELPNYPVEWPFPVPYRIPTFAKSKKTEAARYGSTRVEKEYKHLKTEKDYGRYQYPVRY
jgi:hypothetical protein